jgi:broad specificity phosphatase PhoE
MPEIKPGVPPDRWILSGAGKRRAAALADALATMGATSLHSSDEPKAAETAEIISPRLNLAVNYASGLREHDRNGVPFMPDADWEAAVIDAIRRPGDLVLGTETVEAARLRFKGALAMAEAKSPPGPMVVVSHGTVIAAFVADLLGEDPAPIWEGLGLPGFIVVTWPSAKHIEEQMNFD